MPFLAEIRIFPYQFIPRGWLECAGQVLPANSYSGLYSLIGNTFGGDATRLTFALPDLRDAVPIHPGKAPDSARTFARGDKAGELEVALKPNQIPAHSHVLQRKGTTAIGQKTNVVAGFCDLGQLANVYDNAGSFDLVPHLSTAPPDTMLDPRSIGSAGSGQPHENRQPHLLLIYAICIDGEYPAAD